MRRHALRLTLAAVLLAAQAAPALAQPAPEPAAKPAAVSKFLQPADLDPTLILPPPPADDSPLTAAELAELHRIEAARTPERLAQAKQDDEIEDVRSIADVLGPAFDLQRFPATAALFTDLRNEDSVIAKRAKAYFMRTRPWHADPTLNPCNRSDAIKSAYPSGHATMGYAAATTLANLIPGNGQVILARASEYAESRLVCGAHYRRDIEAGQALGTALVIKLMEKPAFRAELEAARAELTAAHIAP
ncbi:MAG: phosphatase PAP2 family protein [Caulobacterales bacterium]|nr:phosphatase PAP2 family protein [Caulobacterales bacterium]